MMILMLLHAFRARFHVYYQYSVNAVAGRVVSLAAWPVSISLRRLAAFSPAEMMPPLDML